MQSVRARSSAAQAHLSCSHRDTVTVSSRVNTCTRCAYLVLQPWMNEWIYHDNLVGPGFSYARFLKSFQVEASKSAFPHDLFKSYDDLLQPMTEFPPQSAFKSALNPEGVCDAVYDEVRSTWERERWPTYLDYAKFYIRLDVSPFVEATQRLQQFFGSVFGIRVFQDGLVRRFFTYWRWYEITGVFLSDIAARCRAQVPIQQQIALLPLCRYVCVYCVYWVYWVYWVYRVVYL